MTARLALRNILRNRRRSLITIAVIVFGCVGIILFGGYKALTFTGLRESTIRRIGHLQIHGAGLEPGTSQNPLESGLDDVGAIRSVVERDPRVKGTAAQITMMGLVSNGERSETFLATGVEPAKDRASNPYRLVSGTELPDGESDAVLLGRGLAASFDPKPGDFVTLMTTTTTGSLNAMDVRVAGIIATGVKEYDERAVRMPLDGAQQLMQTTRVERLLVFLDQTAETDAVASSLARAFRSEGWRLEIKHWSDLAPFYHQVVLLYEGIFGFIGLIVSAVVIFSVANTVVMSIFERTREMGTLMAMGTTRGRVWRLFFLEGMLTGAIGGAAGLVTGSALAMLINRGKVMLPPPPGYTTGYRLEILLEPRVLVTAFALAIVTATLSSILPALKASRMKIVDALGHI